MDQSFLWKGPNSEDSYAVPADDALLRDRFVNSRLRLDPGSKHELTAEGSEGLSPGIDKRLGALGHLTGIPQPLPLSSPMDQNMAVIAPPGTGPPTSEGTSAHPAAEATSTPGANVAPVTRNVAEGARKVVSTKRAAQNRNSQNAYRKRRQKYMQELESTAEKVKELQKTVEDLRSENMELREFSLALQTRLMELERDDITTQRHRDTHGDTDTSHMGAH